MTHQDSPRRFDVLLTAQEAYPVLEAEFMQAQHEIIAAFRIFDPWTQLRSPQARTLGATWFDLIVATLNRGVRITLILSDFDPVVGMSLHAQAWRSLRGLRAAGEASAHPEHLTLRASMHPARIGLLPRLALWPQSLKAIRDNLAEVNTRTRAEKHAFLDTVPGLRPMLKWAGDTLKPRCAPPMLIPVTHHQKLAVFDEETLYAGGLDLNDRRYDTPDHDSPPDETWHDTQVRVTGPIAREAAAHLRSFEAVTNGAPAPVARHLLRTVSAKRRVSWPFLAPKTVIREIAAAYSRQIAQSEQLIYLETQYFRDRKLARTLARRAAANPKLTLILILPAAPEEVAFEQDPGADAAYGEHLQVTAIKIIQKAFGDRLFIGAPVQPRPMAADGRATHFGAPIIYLHAKVSIFDDRAAIISSANLNGRSMAWDTEVGVQTETPDEVDQVKSRCFAHWLGPDAGPEFHASASACAAWAERARQNAERPPDARAGFILPYLVSPGARLGYNLPGIPEEVA